VVPSGTGALTILRGQSESASFTLTRDAGLAQSVTLSVSVDATSWNLSVTLAS